MYEMSKCVMNFPIAIFQYHDGASVLSKLKPGTKLKLVAEPDNPFDPCAVALYRKNTMLGYVPGDQNAAISQLLHFGHTNVFEAVVISVNPKEKPYRQVYVSIRIRDVRPCASKG